MIYSYEDVVMEIIGIKDIIQNMTRLANELEADGSDPETLEYYRTIGIPYFEARLIEFEGYLAEHLANQQN